MLSLTALVAPKAGPGHGECFMWKRKDDPPICVDAGGSKSAGRHASRYRPQILILSHDDGDHINGAVELINRAGSALTELWVPVEWAILIRQLARTDPDELFPPEAPIEPSVLEERIARGILEVEENVLTDWVMQETIYIDTMEALRVVLALEEYRSENSEDRSDSEPWWGWYGAKNLKQIIDRVLLSAKRLIKIFEATCFKEIKIRFFSIDLALRNNAKKSWLTSGEPGKVTVANALEASYAQAILIPPGIPYAYALCKLTVQNRRALSTLLWNEGKAPDRAVMIWSDSDGNWLDTLSPRGFKTVTSSLLASSAPHHASGNSAHARVWTELSNAPDDMVMISAGGQKNQTYAQDYLNLKKRRSCTWCRMVTSRYQEVTALETLNGRMSLRSQCLGKH